VPKTLPIADCRLNSLPIFDCRLPMFDRFQLVLLRAKLNSTVTANLGFSGNRQSAIGNQNNRQ
ncbi:MAG TPA: hypothetical protein VLA93_20800, partial [Pyrinomonadaceae bacterium]|nr:hypothetical protein [Pyrinomonadaceae bacterium]